MGTKIAFGEVGEGTEELRMLLLDYVQKNPEANGPDIYAHYQTLMALTPDLGRPEALRKMLRGQNYKPPIITAPQKTDDAANKAILEEMKSREAPVTGKLEMIGGKKWLRTAINPDTGERMGTMDGETWQKIP